MIQKYDLVSPLWEVQASNMVKLVGCVVRMKHTTHLQDGTPMNASCMEYYKVPCIKNNVYQPLMSKIVLGVIVDVPLEDNLHPPPPTYFSVVVIISTKHPTTAPPFIII